MREANTICPPHFETKVTKLSLAIYLQDGYSGEMAKGQVDVSIKEVEKKPVKNPSSYYLFLCLPVGDYNLHVKSEYYFDFDKDIKITEDRDPRVPFEANLEPKPYYPFPPGETLVRGVLQDSDNKPMQNVGLNWKSGKGEGRTTETGEFVMYFKGLSEEDIQVKGGKRFLKEGPGDCDACVLSIKIEQGNSPKTLEISNVEVGRTNLVKKVRPS